MKVSEIVAILEEIAPTRNAEPWDNVGLLVGDPRAEIHRVLFTIDYTPEVAEEGKRAGCDLVVSYHPPLFQPIKRITAPGLLYDAIQRGVALYSPHTALDVAEGGTNDMLADVLGLKARAPLRVAQAKATQYKLVVFVPEEAIDRISVALFEAGAGRIGRYSACSFRSPGTGTFFGEAGAQPTVGQGGRLEFVPELRLETVLPIQRVEAVIQALRAVHPYEEPAFDLVPLAAPPESRGMGRMGELEPTSRAELLDRIKAGLELSKLLVAGPLEGQVTRVAACAGSCGDLLEDAIAQRIDLYLTGEMRHHDALKAARAGMTVVCALHSNSERAVLKRVRQRLLERAPALPVHLSQADRDPFSIR
mgnify:CR=1 FL=1